MGREPLLNFQRAGICRTVWGSSGLGRRPGGRARQPGTQLRSDKLGQSQRASGPWAVPPCHPCDLGWEMLAWCVSELKGGAGEQALDGAVSATPGSVRPQDVRTSQKHGDAERKSPKTTARESDSGDQTAVRSFRGRTLLTTGTGLPEDEIGPGEPQHEEGGSKEGPYPSSGAETCWRRSPGWGAGGDRWGAGEGGVLRVEWCPRSSVSNFSKTHPLEGLAHAFPCVSLHDRNTPRQTEAGQFAVVRPCRSVISGHFLTPSSSSSSFVRGLPGDPEKNIFRGPGARAVLGPCIWRPSLLM